jgi:hypothetical protein
MFGAPPPRKTSTVRSTLSVHSESDALPFGRLWYGEPDAISNAIGYAKFFSRAHDAVIRVCDEVGDVTDTHEQPGDFKEPRNSTLPR